MSIPLNQDVNFNNLNYIQKWFRVACLSEQVLTENPKQLSESNTITFSLFQAMHLVGNDSLNKSNSCWTINKHRYHFHSIRQNWVIYAKKCQENIKQFIVKL
jgi:hypothetical protein